MSITQHPQQRYDCDRPDCDETLTTATSVDGSYCSQDCADRARAARLLRHLRQDHRICASCFRLKKEIERPPDTYQRHGFRKSGVELTYDETGTVTAQRYSQDVTREAVVGFEHPTRETERGPYGLECTCGAVSHDAEADYFRQAEAYEWFLKLAVEHLRDEGQADYHFDIETFANALWDGVAFELAVGRALSTP